MAKDRNYLKGVKSEDEAARFLVAQGYEILERRYRFEHKEIDLIARKDGTITFVEVKMRSGKSFGAPVLSIDRKKVQNIVYAAEGYIHENRETLGEMSFRFDVIIFNPPPVEEDSSRLEHIIDAFRP